MSRMRRISAALACSWSVLLSLRRNPLLRVSELILFVIPLLSEAMPLLKSALPASLPASFPQHLSASLALAFYQSALVSAGNLCVDTICPAPVATYKAREAYEIAILEALERRRKLHDIARNIDLASIDEGLRDMHQDALETDSAVLSERGRAALVRAIDAAMQRTDPDKDIMEKKLASLGDWERLDRTRPWSRAGVTLVYAIAATIAVYLSFFSDIVSVSKSVWG
jgi:hypothetical protein